MEQPSTEELLKIKQQELELRKQLKELRRKQRRALLSEEQIAKIDEERKAKLRIYQKRYIARNRDKLNAAFKAYYHKNLEKSREYSRMRYHMMKDTPEYKTSSIERKIERYKQRILAIQSKCNKTVELLAKQVTDVGPKEQQ